MGTNHDDWEEGFDDAPTLVVLRGPELEVLTDAKYDLDELLEGIEDEVLEEFIPMGSRLNVRIGGRSRAVL